MDAKLIVGIDFSKEKMNFCCMDAEKMTVLMEGEVDNNRKGCGEMTKQLRGLRKGLKSGDFLFCGENTGIYSVETAECLTARKYFVWLENPLQISLSSGIRREKTDKADARMIAQYAIRFRDKEKAYTPDNESLKKLRELHLMRRKLKKYETALKNFSGSIRGISGTVVEFLQKVKEYTKECIKVLEKEIEALLKTDEELSENASLAISVPGISWVTASAILLDTKNFSRFDSARKYACHVGCVPHQYTSGTSIHRKPRVSKASNRYVNSLLTQGASSLIYHNRQTKEYAARKEQEGKPNGYIINNVRNKIIHRLFAVIRDKVPFDWNYADRPRKNNHVPSTEYTTHDCSKINYKILA